MLLIQGSGIGCAGLFLAGIGLIAALGGAGFLALALFGGSGVMIAIVAGFGYVAMKQQHRRDRWRLVLIGLEAALFVLGIPLLSWATYASDHAGTPQTPGTDGPFADGWYGLGGSTALAFIAGAVTVAGVMTWEQAAISARRLRQWRANRRI